MATRTKQNWWRVWWRTGVGENWKDFPSQDAAQRFAADKKAVGHQTAVYEI